MDDVTTTDITSLNTEKEFMVIKMDMLLDHAVQDKAIGKFTSAEKKKSSANREC
jgi:hypothetical protein